MSQLTKYIKAIKRGRSINLSLFINLISKLPFDKNYGSKDVTSTKDKANLYFIDLINPDLLRAIKKYEIDSKSTRANAANQNQSHKVKVNGSFLLHRTNSSHPTVILFDGNGNTKGISKQTNDVLIIENRQNFLDITKTITFIEKNTSLNITPNIDILFGAGNEIANSLHHSFLRNYDNLFLLLDVDLGGIKIADNIIKMTPKSKHHYLLPDDIDLRMSNVQKVVSPTYLDKIKDIGFHSSVLYEVSAIITKYRKTLEQESYLNG
jgi:hypothetical protein